MSYLPRIVDQELDQLLPGLPAIALEGAKGVGKTETARRRVGSEHRLDDPEQLAIAQADPRRLLATTPPVLLDEWQRLTPLWDHVRRAVDDGDPPGPFLLTGSAAPASLPAHSGAGRIATVRMRPLSLAERGLGTPTVSLQTLLAGGRPKVGGSSSMSLEAYADEIVRSGFPGLRHLHGRQLRTQLDGYLDRVAERDFVELGHRVRSPQTLRRWMTAYAAATATCTAYEKIRDAATSGEGDKPAKTTTQPYREALERLFLIDAVPAWKPSRNQIARLSSPPKHHFADPALAARLLGVDTARLLDGGQVTPSLPRDGTLLGALFESLLALSVRVYAQLAEARIGHLRTRGGDHEIDLIVERADGRVLAIEVKLSATVASDDVKHLKWLQQTIGDDLVDMMIITTGTEAYRRQDGIAVVPAALLGP